MAVGLVVAALGAAFSAFGASKRKKAIKRAVRAGKARVNQFTDTFVNESRQIKTQKENILKNSEDIFDRLGGFVFGNTDSLSNLRKAQEDFSQLAAGDFSSFNKEASALVSSALADTFGGPSGSFQNTSAKNLLNFRSQGLKDALTLTNTLTGIGAGLIDTEFGIIDNDFNIRLGLEDNRVKQLNSLSLKKASVEGSTLAAVGSGLSSIGSAISSFNTSSQLIDIAKSQAGTTDSAAAGIQSQAGGSFTSSAGPAIAKALPAATAAFTSGDSFSSTLETSEAVPVRSVAAGQNRSLASGIADPVFLRSAGIDAGNQILGATDSFINSAVPSSILGFLGRSTGNPVGAVLGTLGEAAVNVTRTGRSLDLFSDFLPILRQPLGEIPDPPSPISTPTNLSSRSPSTSPGNFGLGQLGESIAIQSASQTLLPSL